MLGAALGYGEPDQIRRLIYRKREFFEGAGIFPHREAKISFPERGRPCREFLLNREQVNLAILLCGLHIGGEASRITMTTAAPRRPASSALLLAAGAPGHASIRDGHGREPR